MTDTVIEVRDQMADLTDMISESAASVRRKFAEYVEYDDVSQEGWVWLLENRRQVDEWLAGGHENLVRFKLLDAMRRYARREKAARCGYHVEDEYFYSKAAIRRLLPVVLVSGGLREASGESEGKPAAGAAYGEWEAAYADIHGAFYELPYEDRQLVWRYHVLEETSADIGAALGLSDATVRGRVDRALARMQKQLGGPNRAA